MKKTNIQPIWENYKNWEDYKNNMYENSNRKTIILKCKKI